MKEFTVSMGLMDLVPVILFCWGSVILIRLMYSKMTKAQFALFSAGTVNITLAGFCKALYKILYGAGICDFTSLSDMFFPVQSIGFMFAGLGVLFMVLNHKDEFFAALAAPPAFFSGTMIFVVLMCVGLGCMDIGLCVQAARDHKKKAIPFLIIAFVCCLSMGYLSSRDFTQAYFNWIAEGINIIGQGSFLGAALICRASSKEK